MPPSTHPTHLTYFLVALACLTIPACSGSVEICENEVRISDINRCNGSVCTVVVRQGTGTQQLGAQVADDRLSLPARVDGTRISVGERGGIIFSTDEELAVTISFSNVPTDCPVAGKRFRFMGTLDEFKQENGCYLLPFSAFEEQ